MKRRRKEGNANFKVLVESLKKFRILYPEKKSVLKEIVMCMY